MAETIVHEMGVEEETASELSVEQMVAEMGRMFAEMKESQKRIDRLSEDTGARLSRIEAALGRLAAA